MIKWNLYLEGQVEEACVGDVQNFPMPRVVSTIVNWPVSCQMLSDCWADGSARNPQVGLPGVSTGPPTAVWRHPSFKQMFFSSKNFKDLYFTTIIV